MVCGLRLQQGRRVQMNPGMVRFAAGRCNSGEGLAAGPVLWCGEDLLLFLVAGEGISSASLLRDCWLPA